MALANPPTANEMQIAHFKALLLRIDRNIARVATNLESLNMQKAAVEATLKTFENKK